MRACVLGEKRLLLSPLPLSFFLSFPFQGSFCSLHANPWRQQQQQRQCPGPVAASKQEPPGIKQATRSRQSVGTNLAAAAAAATQLMLLLECGFGGGDGDGGGDDDGVERDIGDE